MEVVNSSLSLFLQASAESYASRHSASDISIEEGGGTEQKLESERNALAKLEKAKVSSLPN